MDVGTELERALHQTSAVMREPASRPGDSQGFSLIEALIAVTIVMVALAGLAQLFVIAIAANQRAHLRTFATILAQEKIEDLLAPDGEIGEIGEVVSGSDFIDPRGQPIGNGPLPPPGAIYVRRWSAEPMPANPVVSVLQVWVVLSLDVAGGEAARIVGVKTSRTR